MDAMSSQGIERTYKKYKRHKKLRSSFHSRTRLLIEKGSTTFSRMFGPPLKEFLRYFIEFHRTKCGNFGKGRPLNRWTGFFLGIWPRRAVNHGLLTGPNSSGTKNSRSFGFWICDMKTGYHERKVQLRPDVLTFDKVWKLTPMKLQVLTLVRQ